MIVPNILRAVTAMWSVDEGNYMARRGQPWNLGPAGEEEGFKAASWRHPSEKPGSSCHLLKRELKINHEH